MVKLDANVLRYMSREEFRVLTAVEMGMKNHELVPTTLICRIAGLKSGGAFKHIGSLHKNKLIVHENKKYDGYRLTYLGYDYLALKALSRRGAVNGIGRRIGVGKESDIYEVTNEEGRVMVLKIHRLGRTSFRAIKSKRDYLMHRKKASWLYLSRLAAIREYAYMKALFEHDFPVPEPVDQNRHTILMEKIPAYPFAQVSKIRHVGEIYSSLMNMVVRLAEHGLIHCDFNEFNLMINDSETLTLIDFPQMVSTSHRNAAMYFDRDVQCIRTYFRKRFHFHSDQYPTFSDDSTRTIDLDAQLKASGNNNVSQEEVYSFDRLIEMYNNRELPTAREGSEDEREGDEAEADAEAGEEQEGEEGEEEEEEEKDVARHFVRLVGSDDRAAAAAAAAAAPAAAAAAEKEGDNDIDIDELEDGYGHGYDAQHDKRLEEEAQQLQQRRDEDFGLDAMRAEYDNADERAKQPEVQAQPGPPEVQEAGDEVATGEQEVKEESKSDAEREAIRRKLARKFKAKGTPNTKKTGKARGDTHAGRNTQKGKQKRANMRVMRDAGY